MILPVVFAILALCIAAIVLSPLWRGKAVLIDQADHERGVYRARMEAVATDVDRGLLGFEEAEARRLEIQRRLLNAAAPAAPPPVRKSWLMAASVGATVVAASTGLYLLLGTPAPPSSGVAGAVTELADHLRAHPSDGAAWTLYARAVSRLDRWDDAETAWRHAVDLGAASPEARASLGEILVLRNGGAVNAEARALFDEALRGDPKNDIARYYFALSAFQNREFVTALALWQGLLDDMPPDAPGRREVTRRMTEASRMSGAAIPPGADNPEARAAMIEGMVAKLAARLKDNPNDADGWAQLGKSYGVLGRGEASADAYEKAAALKNGEPSMKLAAAEALLMNVRTEDQVPARAVALLKEIEAATPGVPAALWYLGLASAQSRDFTKAREFWRRLAQILPPDAPESKMVRESIAALPPLN